MADDRSIAPSPARWRLAWLAGLRWRSRWLWPALACAGLAMVLGSGAEVGETGSGSGFVVLDVSPAPSIEAGLSRVQWMAVPWLLAGAAVILVSVIGRRLGPVSSAARLRLDAAPPHGAVGPVVVLAIVVGIGVLSAMVGVLAGAARSVDASEAGLGMLWWGWASTVLTVMAGGLGLLALGELVLDRRERGLRLRQSPQQVREQARASGAR